MEKLGLVYKDLSEHLWIKDWSLNQNAILFAISKKVVFEMQDFPTVYGYLCLALFKLSLLLLFIE